MKNSTDKRYRFEPGKTYSAIRATRKGLAPFLVTVEKVEDGFLWYRTSSGKWKKQFIYVEDEDNEYHDGIEYIRPPGWNELAPYIYACHIVGEE